MSHIATGSEYLNSLVLCRHGGVTSNSPLISLGLKNCNVHFSALTARNLLSKALSNRTRHPCTFHCGKQNRHSGWALGACLKEPVSVSSGSGGFTASLHPSVSWKDIHVLSRNPEWFYTTKCSCLNESPVISMAQWQWLYIPEYPEVSSDVFVC